MDKQFDELSKSLAEEGVSRREALRRLGKGLAGLAVSAILTMIGGESEAQGLVPCTRSSQCRSTDRYSHCCCHTGPYSLCMPTFVCLGKKGHCL